jgi:hypothetical protein
MLAPIYIYIYVYIYVCMYVCMYTERAGKLNKTTCPFIIIIIIVASQYKSIPAWKLRRKLNGTVKILYTRSQNTVVG